MKRTVGKTGGGGSGFGLAEMVADAGELLRKSHSPVFFTGAGMSKESGIPTFREALTGLWSRYDPEQLASSRAFAADPGKVREFYEHRRAAVRKCRPNAGHVAIAELESTVSNVVVVTQNVDGFHEAAGSTTVIPLHGNIMEDRCNAGCTGSYPAGTHPRRCPACGLDSMRPSVVWFGEPLDEDVLVRAAAAITTCDLLCIVGTSGMVYPAAGLVQLAFRSEAPVIEINPEETPFSGDARISLRGRSAELIPHICRSSAA